MEVFYSIGGLSTLIVLFSSMWVLVSKQNTLKSISSIYSIIGILNLIIYLIWFIISLFTISGPIYLLSWFIAFIITRVEKRVDPYQKYSFFWYIPLVVVALVSFALGTINQFQWQIDLWTILFS